MCLGRGLWQGQEGTCLFSWRQGTQPACLEEMGKTGSLAPHHVLLSFSRGDKKGEEAEDRKREKYGQRVDRHSKRAEAMLSGPG